MGKFYELYSKGCQTILGFACLFFSYQTILFILMLRDYVIKFVAPSNLYIIAIVLTLLVPVIGYFDFKKNDFLVNSYKGRKILKKSISFATILLLVVCLFGLRFYAQKNNIIWPLFACIFLVDAFYFWFLFYTAKLGKKA